MSGLSDRILKLRIVTGQQNYKWRSSSVGITEWQGAIESSLRVQSDLKASSFFRNESTCVVGPCRPPEPARILDNQRVLEIYNN